MSVCVSGSVRVCERDRERERDEHDDGGGLARAVRALV